MSDKSDSNIKESDPRAPIKKISNTRGTFYILSLIIILSFMIGVAYMIYHVIREWRVYF